MELLLPLLIPMSWYDPFVSIGSAIMRASLGRLGILVLAHNLFALVKNSGWTWVLSIVMLTVVIRTALIPLFVKQIKSSRSMQLFQPKVRELQKKSVTTARSSVRDHEALQGRRREPVGVLSAAAAADADLPGPLPGARRRGRHDDAGNPYVRGYWLKQNPDLVESLNQATIFGARIFDTFLKVPLTDGISSVHLVTVFLIIAMTVTLFVAELQLMKKNMPPEALTGRFAQQQKIMLYVFPLIFAVGGINFPVGVLIYWFTSNLWTMTSSSSDPPQPGPRHAGVRRLGGAPQGAREATPARSPTRVASPGATAPGR